MEPNPYESPKEVKPGPGKGRGLLAIVLGTIGVIPAGCICGGLTCFSTNVSVEAISRNVNSPPNGLGGVAGILLGVLVMVFVWHVVRHQSLKRDK